MLAYVSSAIIIEWIEFHDWIDGQINIALVVILHIFPQILYQRSVIKSEVSKAALGKHETVSKVLGYNKTFSNYQIHLN